MNYGSINKIIKKLSKELKKNFNDNESYTQEDILKIVKKYVIKNTHMLFKMILLIDFLNNNLFLIKNVHFQMDLEILIINFK